MSTKDTDLTFEREKATWERLKPSLLQDDHYRGKWVAIVDEKVVDIDTDEIRLVKRVYATHGYRAIYVGEVTETERITEEPSAEIVENNNPEFSRELRWTVEG